MQAARNVAGHVQRKENEVQGLLKMHAMAASSQKAGQPVNWTAIKRAVLRSKPPFAAVIDHLVNFLATKSGGVSGEFLLFFQAFHRSFVQSSVRASVPGPLYSALAELKGTFVAYAILEMAFTCPPEFVRQGQCSWVSAAEVGQLGKDIGRFRAAEEVLSWPRTVLQPAGLTQVRWGGPLPCRCRRWC